MSSRRGPSAAAIHRPELAWVGRGAWVACDPALPPDDARRVIAYLECKNQHVSVLWVRDRHDECSFDTLREALDAVSAAPAPVQLPEPHLA